MTEENNILPKVPTGWFWTKFEQIGAHKKNAIVDGPFGSNLKVADYIDGSEGVRVLTTKNLEEGYSNDKVRFISYKKFEELRRSEVVGGDILIAKIGSCGKTAIYPEGIPSAMIPANLMKMSVHPYIERKFIYYFLHCNFFKDELKGIIRATAQPAFSISRFKKLFVPIAPLPEQKRIVARIEELFTQLDAGVTELHKAKAQLKRYRQAVLKAAVEGELTREWREAHQGELEPASELLERILAERRAKWEEEELAKMRVRGKEPKDDKWKKKYEEPEKPDIDGFPELPEGWEWIGVGQVAELRNGINFNKSQKGDKGILTIDVLNMYSNSLYIDFENLYRVDTNINNDLTLRRGDILFVRSSVKREGVGWAACFKEHEELVTFCGFIIRARLVSERIYPEFVTHCMRTSKTRHDIISGSSQVTITNINQKALSKIVFPLTSLDEQKLIADKVERRLSIADEIERQLDQSIQRARHLRQSILKRAFEGKLVPQDPSDEPASLLLKRIEAGKKLKQLTGKTKGKSKGHAKKAGVNQLDLFKEDNLLT